MRRKVLRWLVGLLLAVVVCLVVGLLVTRCIPVRLVKTPDWRTLWGVTAGGVAGGVVGLWAKVYATAPPPGERSATDGEGEAHSGAPQPPSTGEVIVEGANGGIVSTGDDTRNWQGVGEPPPGLLQAAPESSTAAGTPQGSGAVRLTQDNPGIASTGRRTVNIQNQPR